MKETFAYAALRCLFSLCSKEKQGLSFWVFVRGIHP
jgi:hypothetical protein